MRASAGFLGAVSISMLASFMLVRADKGSNIGPPNEASETFPLSRSSSMHSSNDLRREAGVGSMPGDGLDLLAAAACIG